MSRARRSGASIAGVHRDAVLLTGLVVAFLVGALGSAVANIHMATLRQELTPPGLLGRLNASYRLIAWGALPVGALTGGCSSPRSAGGRRWRSPRSGSPWRC